MNTTENILLEVKNLKTYFYLDEGVLKAVDGVDFTTKKGKTLGMVGESGCGKSVTAQAILNIVPKPGKIEGEILLYKEGGQQPIDLAKLDPFGQDMRNVRGAEIAMIFQEPMKAFHPMYTIGNQIMESLLLHVTDDKVKAREITIDMLKRVGMPNAEQRVDEYPHQLSGGMRQRAMIAMALCCHPSILIADEPTTALDVTIQAQVLQLIKELQGELGMAVIFITHDLGVIAEMADDVAVMYLGRIVEQCDVESLFYDPLHPYTKALLGSIPEVGKAARTKLVTIEGTVPVPLNLGKRCGFYSRCKEAKEGICNTEDPPMIEVKPGHFVRCFQET